MASPSSTPRSLSPSRLSTASSNTSDLTMLDAPPLDADSNAAGLSTDSSPASSTFSLLLSLPRELRDHVYKYALSSELPFWWPAPTPVKHDIALGLLTASKQVYKEAAPILYGSNKFIFTHPSDCTMFRVIASPEYSALMSTVYFRIRDKDVRLWTAYLGSTMAERSLKSDLPKLQTLWISLHCSKLAPTGLMAQVGGNLLNTAGLPAPVIAQVHAVQHVLAQQIQALHQQVLQLSQTIGQAAQTSAQGSQQQNGSQGGNNQVPPPPPPAPAGPMASAQALLGPLLGTSIQQHVHLHPPPGQPHAHGTQNNPPNPSPLAHMAQQHRHGPFHAFLRWERELGLENLCFSLKETRPVDAKVKIVCIMRLPKPEVERMCRLYRDELTVDKNGNASTKFRKLHGVEVSLEISGVDVVV